MCTVETIRKLSDIKKIEKLLSKHPRDLLLFTLGTNSGLRISDILALNVSDVKNKNSIQIHEKKTGKFKSFPINAKLKPMFKKYTKGKNINEPLFMTKFGNRLDRFQAYRIIKRVSKEAGVNGIIGSHSLRKSFGYHFYKKYKDVVLLQKIFNHSTPQVTLRYIGIEQEIIDKSYKDFIL